MIGILQGRLTVPWNGKLQCFPRGRWEEEFQLAKEAGFDALELFVETEFNADNPVWSESGRARIRDLASRNRVGARVLCADCFMTTTFADQPGESLELLNRLASFGFEWIVLPFFEKAELADLETVGDVERVLERFPRRSMLAIETSLRPEILCSMSDRLGLGICYDLGNTTALGHDVPGDIRKLGKRIVHVHVKDKRQADGQNVVLGTGDTDFAGAFAALRDVGYVGDVTCETNRGDDPVAQARIHRRFVGRLLGEPA